MGDAHARRGLLVALIAAALGGCALGSGCTLGEEQAPGCRVDHPNDCGAGYTCREGVCFRPTTGLTPPDASASDAGASDASDASEASKLDAKQDALDAPEGGREAEPDAEPDEGAGEEAADAAGEQLGADALEAGDSSDAGTDAVSEAG
jgi:hypothetical protein